MFALGVGKGTRPPAAPWRPAKNPAEEIPDVKARAAGPVAEPAPGTAGSCPGRPGAARARAGAGAGSAAAPGIGIRGLRNLPETGTDRRVPAPGRRIGPHVVTLGD